MTGRKGRVVNREDGEVQYELRHDQEVTMELTNIVEKNRFMDAEKVIPILLGRRGV